MISISKGSHPRLTGFLVPTHVFEVGLGSTSSPLSVLISYFKDGEGYIAHRKDLSALVNDHNTVDAIPGILSGLISRDDLG